MKLKLLAVFMLTLCCRITMMAQKHEFAKGLYWELKSGTLTISGNGYMHDYDKTWDEKYIEKIIIYDGITSIGECAFWHNKNLKSVILSNSIETIKDFAFYDCTNLQSIEIPNSVKTIESQAFQNCSNLQSVVFGNSIKTIGFNAFDGCHGLKSIVIPQSIQIIKRGAFANCRGLQSVTICNPSASVSRGSFYDSPNVTVLKPISDNNQRLYIAFNPTMDKCGLVNDKGLWVIPRETCDEICIFENNYIKIRSKENYKYGLYSCDGKEIIAPEVDALMPAGRGFIKFKINGFWGVMNYNGRIIIPTDRGYTYIGDFVSLTKRFPYEMDGYKGECNQLGKQLTKFKVSSSNTSTTTPSSTRSSSSSSKSSSTSTNNGSSKNESTNNNTTKVVVEHHRDPVPVQEWIPCGACNGSGQCGTCNGTGKNLYSSDPYAQCISCSGMKKCKYCAGRGGHHETIYR